MGYLASRALEDPELDRGELVLGVALNETHELVNYIMVFLID